jgi:hypothetical protein
VNSTGSNGGESLNGDMDDDEPGAGNGDGG